METALRARAGLAEVLLEYVDAAGGSRRALLAEVGPAAIAPSEPRRMLDVRTLARLLDGAARMLGDASVGLHFAAHFELGTLGPFSYAVLHAPTLGTALRNVARYSGSVAVGAQLRLDIEGRTARLTFPSWGDDPEDFRQLGEAAMLVFLRMLRRLAGPGWSPLDVGLRHAAPADVREHRRLLGPAVRFGCPSDRIRFAASDLERTVRDADRFLLPIVERQLQDVVSDVDGPDPWRHELEMLVASHVCDGHPSIRSLAPRLGLSVRTLQRRLDERGLCYKRLVADVRFRIARQYLEEAEPSLGEIGFLLGYSELSAFDRAFRKWTGISPGEYRRRRQEMRTPTGVHRSGPRQHGSRDGRAPAGSITDRRAGPGAARRTS